MTFQRVVILTFRLNVLFAVHLKRKRRKKGTCLRIVEMRPVSQLGAGHKLWVLLLRDVVLASTLLFWPL